MTTMLGKKVINNVYWHSSVTPLQAAEVQHQLVEAETLAKLQVDIDYNVVKYDVNNGLLSLLWYPCFFEHPFRYIFDHVKKVRYSSIQSQVWKQAAFSWFNIHNGSISTWVFYLPWLQIAIWAQLASIQ